MTIRDFDRWCREVCNFSIKDMAINGLQVGLLDKPLHHIAFALDACQASFELAKQADMLFVHHGLFWGYQSISDELANYPRIKMLIEHDLALYALHLPLDAAENLGNNAILAQNIDLTNIERFGEIGFIGDLLHPMLTQELASAAFSDAYPLTIWPHHNDLVKRVAVLCGGGARANYITEAINAGATAYVTGEINHQIYHYTSELGLNVVAGGHYHSEYIGLAHFAKAVTKEFPQLQISIYDLPTGC